MTPRDEVVQHADADAGIGTAGADAHYGEPARVRSSALLVDEKTDPDDAAARAADLDGAGDRVIANRHTETGDRCLTTGRLDAGIG